MWQHRDPDGCLLQISVLPKASAATVQSPLLCPVYCLALQASGFEVLVAGRGGFFLKRASLYLIISKGHQERAATGQGQGGRLVD
jgi:hypothetical protein